MKEQAKRGRPVTREDTKERHKSQAVLADARAIWGDRFTSEDQITDLLAAPGCKIGKDLLRSHDSTMPRNLILAIESAGPEHMCIDDVEKAVLGYRNHQRMVTENRKQGQEPKKAAAAEEAEQLLRNTKIQHLINRLKPKGNLTANGAATMACAILKDGLEPGTSSPSARKLRDIFIGHQRKLLAEQLP